MKRTAMAIISVLLLLMFIDCPPVKATEDRVILIGLIPEENIFRHYERYLPLAEYLSNLLNRPVKLTILSKYGDVIDRFSERRMDGAFFGALTGYIAIHKLGLRPLVVPVLKDGTYASPAYIVIRKDIPYKSISDLQGSVAAFVDRATARGYLFLVSYLRSKGVKKPEKFFREIFFTGSHDAALYAVADGRADITSIKATVFKKIIQKDPLVMDELKIIAHSEAIVDSVMCIRDDMDPKTVELLLNGLLRMHENPEGRELLKKMGLKRFVRASMDHFKEVERLLKTAGTNVRRYNYRIELR
jgi:phosphonate transport system substrate-binding protein